MGIISTLERSGLRADQGSLPFDDPRLWTPYNSWDASNAAGYPITRETVMRISTVFACVSLKAETIGTLPCHLYRRLDNGGRERAKEHRCYRTARQTPNGQDTAIDFFTRGESRVNLSGLALAEIHTRRDRVELVPYKTSDITKTELLDGNRLRWEVIDPVTRQSKILLQDEVLYVRDLMQDGFAAVGRAVVAQEAIAVAAAAEAFVGGFFRNDATGRLALSLPTNPDEKTKAAYRQMVNDNYAGWRNRSKTMFLWGGMTATELGKHDDNGFIVDPRNYQVADIARFFGRIPLFMIGLEEKSTTWGTGIEQQTQAWINYGMLPSIVRWEQALNRDLLQPEEQEEYFFEFNLDGLLRGDSMQRAQVNEIKRRNGVINPDEWRLSDNMNPRKDGGGEEYLDTPTGAAPNAGTGPKEPDPKPKPQEQARIIPAPLLADAVHRIASREIDDVGRRAARATDTVKWAAWVTKYYAAHRDYVVKVLAPIGEAFGFEHWVLEEAAGSIQRTAEGLIAAAVPDFLARRRDEITEILEETFTAGAAARQE